MAEKAVTKQLLSDPKMQAKKSKWGKLTRVSQGARSGAKHENIE